MQILVMGGTRFVGKPLVARLMAQGHALTLFTRGKNPVPAGVEHITGDRSSDEGLSALQGRAFDVIVDSSGRTLDDSRRVLMATGHPRHRFVYVSSAGVYAGSDHWPLDENSPTDPKSRHAGKADTEAWLTAEGVPFTSFRPTYIYGPGNYNPVERRYIDRKVQEQPQPHPHQHTTAPHVVGGRSLCPVGRRCGGALEGVRRGAPRNSLPCLHPKHTHPPCTHPAHRDAAHIDLQHELSAVPCGAQVLA